MEVQVWTGPGPDHHVVDEDDGWFCMLWQEMEMGFDMHSGSPDPEGLNDAK